MSSPTMTFLRLTPDAPAPARAPPSSFLTLAPSTSSSYPRRHASVDSNASDESVSAARPAAPAARPTAAAAAAPRHNSIAAMRGQPRMLKLGPVHWGEHLGENKGDFAS